MFRFDWYVAEPCVEYSLMAFWKPVVGQLWIHTWNRITGFQNLVWMTRYQFSLNRLLSVSGRKASHHHMRRVIHHTSSSSSCDYVTRFGWGTRRRVRLNVDSWEVNQWDGSLFMDMIRVNGWWISNCSVETNDSVLFWTDKRMDRETPFNTDWINGSFIVFVESEQFRISLTIRWSGLQSFWTHWSRSIEMNKQDEMNLLDVSAPASDGWC